jgi:hypothetical protein
VGARRIQNAAAMQPTWESPAAKSGPSRISAVPPRLLQAAGRRPTQVDNSGISAQRTGRDGRSWTACPLLRIRRLGVRVPRACTPSVHPERASQPASQGSVKARLTPNRRRWPVENDEYASFVRRVIRAHARRVAAGDVDALADMTGLIAELDEAITRAVTGLRKAGYSWAEIAARLGVTRQAAQQPWGRL